MRDLPVDLDSLIAHVDRPDLEPLQLVTEAMIVSERIGDLGDELVDHYVQRARDAGASWAAIGANLGVSKQAAQKRFRGKRSRFTFSKGGLFTRFDESGRFVVRSAVSHAHRLHSTEINTLHLIMGLTDPESDKAAAAISALAGSTAEVTETAGAGLVGTTGSPRNKHLPFSDENKKVLELSLREAIRAGSRGIGSEHVLLGLLRTTESRGSEVLDQFGVTRAGVETWLSENPR